MDSDEYRYTVIEGWGLGPEGYVLGDMICGVAVDSRDHLFAFRRNPSGAVLVFDRTGRFITSWGEGVFAEAHAIWVDRDDCVYCTDREDHTVRKFSPDGELLLTLGTPHRTGAPGMPFNTPAKAVTAPCGDIWVADGYGQARIHRFSPAGELLQTWGEPGQGESQFNLPHSLVVDDAGCVIVVDRENHRIQLFDEGGNLLDIWTGLRQPMDIALSPDGAIFIAEAYQRVTICDPAGRFLSRWGELGETPGQFASFLHGICLDSRGDLYVADERRLQKFARV